MRETDADRSWQAGHGEREPANEMNKEDPRHSCLDIALHCESGGRDRACAGTFLWKSELRFGRWCFKSGDTKAEAQCSCLRPQKPKEIYSGVRNVWWFDNCRAQNPQRRTWILEQSPIRCRGTSSRHSMESVSNRNFTGDGEEFTKVPRVVAEATSYSYVQFKRIWQVLWRIIMESSNNYTSSIRDKRNCRTSCGFAERAVRWIKEETSAVFLQSGSDDKW